MIPSKSSKLFLYFFIGVFLLIAGLLTFGDIQRSSAFGGADTSEVVPPQSQLPSCPQITSPSQATFCPNGTIKPIYNSNQCIVAYDCVTVSAPLPQYQVQDIPISFKPTAVPPGNNVAAPLNTGSETQTKAGALNVGSLNAGTINSGSVAASGNLNITGNFTVSGTFNLQGHNIRIASVPSTPVYKTSYGSWSVQTPNVGGDTCHSDILNPYTCVPGITQSSCKDFISYQGGAHNSFTFYQQRSVSCWTEYNMINTLVVE